MMGKKLTPLQAARRAGVSRRTIGRWMGDPARDKEAKGGLRVSRTAGGHARIDSDDLEAYLAEGATRH